MPTVSPILWSGDPSTGHLRLLDQTRLPSETVYIDCRDVETVFEAIRSLRVRGAPALGVAAAYGVVVGMKGTADRFDSEFVTSLTAVCERLASSRPTAVNLFWALDRMRKVGAAVAGMSGKERLVRLHREATAIETEDRAMCAAIGQVGAAFLKDGMSVLTHCNAGSLATAGDGTALAVIYAAREQGKQIEVYADETRPLLQGARLTCWELAQRGVPTTLICDSMAGWVMKSGMVQAVIVGADRIAANGDTANKIGTYSVAQLAKAHAIPFYVAAPSSTFDLTLADGSGIPIEERAASEITHGFGKATAPDGVRVFNPAFDVTPASLIRAIFTERGAIEPVNSETVRKCLR